MRQVPPTLPEHGGLESGHDRGLGRGAPVPELPDPARGSRGRAESDHPRGPSTQLDPTDPNFITDAVNAMVSAYPTPEILRDKAGRLEARRRDPQGEWWARFMRAVADDLESGALWEDYAR